MNFKLRKFRITDADDIVEQLNNINVCRNLADEIPFPYTKKDAEYFIKVICKQKNNYDFAIIVNGKVVGAIGFVNLKGLRKHTAELGFWLGESYWNNGIITEAIKKIKKEIFKKDIVRIQSHVFEWNKASCRVLEKNGFKKEGTLKKSILKENKITNRILYSYIK